MQNKDPMPPSAEERHKLAGEYLRKAATERHFLRRAAMDGDAVAFAVLITQAQFLNAAVAEIGKRHPDLLKGLAAYEGQWPLNVEADPASLKKHASFLKKIALGRELKSPFGAARGPKRARLDSPAQAISVMIWDWLWVTRAKGTQHAMIPYAERACNLPQWAPEHFEQWFACGWEYYLAAFDGDVFNDSNARALIASNDLGKNKPEGYLKDRVRKASAWWTD